jgi:hypothetical protein
MSFFGGRSLARPLASLAPPTPPASATVRPMSVTVMDLRFS